MKGRLVAGSVLLGLLSFAASAAADWLVVRDGGRVETKGAWQIKGKLVVFTRTDGSLSSLKLAEVDLEASRKATEAAEAETAAPPPAPPPPKKKLAVLTDKDFARKEPPAAEPAAERGSEESKEEKDAGPTPTVSVASWRQVERPTSDGLEIHGTLQNNTDRIAAGVAVEVQLFNETGERVGTAPGIPNTPSIQPRGTVEFRATFPGVFTFATAKFEVKGFPLDISPADQPQAEAPPQ